MGNIKTDIPIQQWITELAKLKIPEHDPYGWPGADSSSIEKQVQAQKWADIGLWRQHKARGWSMSKGTTTADIVLILNGRNIGIFSNGNGSIIKFSPSSKKSTAMMGKLIVMVTNGISAPVVNIQWEKEFHDKYCVYDEEFFKNEEFIIGIQKLIDTGRLWEDRILYSTFKRRAYRLIIAGKCHRKEVCILI